MSRASETAERPACRAAASRSCSQIPAAAESSLERRKLCWQRRGTSASDQRRGSQPASGDGPAPAATHSDSVAPPAPCFLCGLNERRRRRSQPAQRCSQPAAMHSASGDRAAPAMTNQLRDALCQRRRIRDCRDMQAASGDEPAAAKMQIASGREAVSRRRASGEAPAPADAASQRR